MAFFKNESLWGTGMVILQVLRVCNIISLLSAAVASWTLIVKIKISTNFFFFDAASLFFTSTVCVFLTISELPFFKPYFRRTWPVLSDEHGLTWLGAGMNLIGCTVLGKLHQPANSSENIGLPWWRLVLASGIVTIIFGVMNIVCSFIFRDGDQGITPRLIRSHGALAANAKASLDDQAEIDSPSVHSDSDEKPTFMSSFWKFKNRSDEPSEKPYISHPMPTHYDVERNAGSDSDGDYYDDNDQTEDRRSPILPQVRRPDTALHPMNSRRSSFYSQAHMSRF